MTNEPLSDDAERGFLLYFCRKLQSVTMGVFLAILIMMTTGSVAILFVVKMLKREYSSDEKFHLVLRYLVLSVIIILCDLLWGGKALILRLPFDMLVTIFPIMVVTSSIWDDHIALKMSRTLSAFVWMLALFYILHGVGVFPSVSPMHFITCSGIISMLICSAFLLSIILRMREIRQVMKSGNVWSSVCMSIDVIYLLSIVIYITAILVTARVSVTVLIIISVLVSFLLACEMAALGMRVSTDSIFLFWKRQERLIVESMKISQTDVAQDSSKINDMYKDIYTRIVALFESEKLYLNSELTINDIVKVTFTNKLYIS